MPGQRRSRRWKRACEAAEEGIVGKRLDSLYVPGRSDAWVKIKCVGRQEFVIAGWTDPQRSRVGLGALLVGYYEGDRLRYAGKVGTGYTREVLLDLRKRFDELGQKANPFDDGEPPLGEAVHWVEPKLVAEIAFAEWTQNGLLRQPRYEGLRPDKKAIECRRERPAPAAAVRRNAAPTARETPPCRWRNTTRNATSPRPASRPARRRRSRTSSRSSSCRSTTPRSIHYDFRLEADGVLKSWSVPKGPSMDPSVKRLAVQVEDHPIGYATFEGTIPQGQYGGGTVKIWDHGTYESLMDEKAEPQTAAEAIEAGRIEFVMHGERLKGKFALIRMKPRGKGKPQWLLMKLKDEFAEAGSEEKPRSPRRNPRPPPRRPPRPARAGTARPRRRSSSPTPTASSIPEAGLTKADVFAYYEKVADRLLPFLKDRPITLERLPDGLAEKAPHFWQKDTPDYYPDWIPRIELETERGKTVHYALVNDEPTLLYLVNQGTLTFHVWASRTKDLDRPDFVLFDLDPGKASFADVVAVARAIKATLDEEGVESFVKTSGKTGLHVLTPWTRDGGFRRGAGPGRWSSPNARPRRCPSRPPSTSARRSAASGSTSTSCRTPAATTPSRPTSCGRCPGRRSRPRWTGRRSPRGSTRGRSR